MIYGSVCSGIEAASVAFDSLGWTPEFFSEIDAFPRAVLKHHYPHVKLYGDFRHIQSGTHAIDLLIGGTPCQSFSIAGLRQGLDAATGNLALEYIKLAARLRPRWLVWENVPGILSIDGGRAFGTFIGGLVECGYSVSWRILDAQYCGVPQRRRRVFVVGHLGTDWRPSAAVLFERESLLGNLAPSRKEREDVTGTLGARTTAGGGFSSNFECAGGVQVTRDLSPCIGASGRGFERTGDTRGQDAFVACFSGTLETENAACLEGHGVRIDLGTETFVTHPLRADGFDASEDGTGRGTPIIPVIAIQERAICENADAGPDGKGFRDDGNAFTLEARTVPQAVVCNESGKGFWSESEVSSTIRKGDLNGHGGARESTLIAFDLRGRDGGAMPEMSQGTASVRASSGGSSRSYVAFAENSRAELRLEGGDGDTVGALKTGGGKPGQSYPAIAFQSSQSGMRTTGDVHATLDANNGSRRHHGVVASGVRRLTVKECERLQGLPDNWTNVPYRGKPACDGPRYKAIGNSFAVPVVRWIAERIQMVDNILSE
jgi:DNA (cytosine-5)-methyltransferase 1